MFNNLTPRAQQVFVLAKKTALKLHQNYLGTEHLLLGLLELNQGIAVRVLQRLGLDVETVHDALEQHIVANKPVQTPALVQTDTTDLPLTPRVKRVLALAEKVARELKHPYIGTEHLLLGLLEEGDGFGAKILKTLDIDPKECRNEIMAELIPDVDSDEEEDFDDIDYEDDDVDDLFVGHFSQEKPQVNPLKAYGVDLTKKARDQQLDPVIGRRKELDRMIQILCRRTKNNPVLIGEAGVGKTAIVEGLAQEIVAGKVPDLLMNKRVIILDLAQMVSGTKYRGQFEERLKNVMEEVKKNKDVILFLDELHTLVGAGSAEGSMDASNILKPALARGYVQCIGATTLDEYRRYIEKDSALNRRFQSILVNPPTVDETLDILKGLQPKYESFHRVHFSESIIKKAIQLTNRYVCDRFFPDKAIDLLDEAGARAHISDIKKALDTRALDVQIQEAKTRKSLAIRQQKFEEAAQWRDKEQDFLCEKEQAINNWKKKCSQHIADVDEALLRKIVFEWTGIPIENMDSKELKHYLNLDKRIEQKVIGQKEAVEIVCRALKRSRVDLKDPRRPIGSFLFLGPTGIGKTWFVKVLAEEMFGNRDAVIQIDMSEYMEKHTVSRLIGSPPGYVGHEDGGQLTEAVRRKPYSIVLFDEIEKAHPDAIQILLQVLEEGRLTDGLGRTVDFKNTIIVMTSNVGAQNLQRSVGLGFSSNNQLSFEQLKESVQDATKAAFRPEFLNRLNDIVVFHPLSREQIGKIVDLEVAKVTERLADRSIHFVLSADAKDFIIKRGYDEKYGARPMKRAIERYVEDCLADGILMKTIPNNCNILLDVDSEVDGLKAIVKKANKRSLKKTCDLRG